MMLDETRRLIEAQLPPGYTTYYKPAKARAIGASGRWVIVAERLGYQTATVTSPEQVPAALGKITAAYQRATTAPVAVSAPTPAPPTTRPVPTRPTRSRCISHEEDNHGRCYSCGTYVPAADAGRYIF